MGGKLLIHYCIPLVYYIGRHGVSHAISNDDRQFKVIFTSVFMSSWATVIGL